jgi:hypothetical protein
MCQLILMGITISTTTLWKLKWLRAYYGTAQDNPSTNPGSADPKMDPGFQTLAAMK